MNKAQESLPPNFVHELPLDLIDNDPAQPRTEFDEVALLELAEDIKRHGVRQPIEVRCVDGRYVVETGERRCRAARIAGLDTVPALAARPHAANDHFDDPDEPLERLLHQARENIQRAELTVMDKARLLRRLRDDHGIPVGELPDFCRTKGLGDWSRSHVSNMIRMTNLPEWFTARISSGEIPQSAAKHVAQIADLERAMERFQEEFEGALEARTHYPDEGPITEDEIENLVYSVAANLYIEADRSWDKRAAYYDVEAHAETVGLRNISGRSFITDLFAHEALQAQHPKPLPNSPAAKSPHIHGEPDKGEVEHLTSDGETGAGADGKPAAEKKPKDKLLDVKNVQAIEAYIIDWWRHYISLHARTPAMVRAVIEWAAAGAPSNHDATFGYSVMHDNLSVAQVDAQRELKRDSLAKFLAAPLEEDDALALFDRILAHMGKRAIVDIVTHNHWHFDKCYVIDQGFLDLNTKATLDRLVRDTVCKGKAGAEARASWADQVKLADMREWCLARSGDIGVPKELAKVWRDMSGRAK